LASTYTEEQKRAIAQMYAAAGLPSPFRDVVPLQPAGQGKGDGFVAWQDGQPPASAPAPAPAPGPTPGWEGDLGYQEALSWAQNQRNQADAQYAQELAGLGSSTGLFDAQGNPIDQQQVEQLNPFSQAGMLRRAWRQAQTGGLNSYAAAGQLYSGALKNAVGVDGADPRSQLYEDQRGGYNSFNYQANLGGLKSSYDQQRNALDRWRLGIGGDIDERLLDTSQEARDRWLDSRPPAPSRGPTASAPGSVEKGTLGSFQSVTRDMSGEQLRDAQDVYGARPPKPPARKGYRVVWRDNRWVQVPRTLNG
jgi:hypothetical protein